MAIPHLLQHCAANRVHQTVSRGERGAALQVLYDRLWIGALALSRPLEQYRFSPARLLTNLAARQQLSTHCLDLLPTPNVGLPLCATSRAGFGSPRSARLRAIAYGLPMPVCGG